MIIQSIATILNNLFNSQYFGLHAAPRRARTTYHLWVWLSNERKTEIQDMVSMTKHNLGTTKWTKPGSTRPPITRLYVFYVITGTTIPLLFIYIFFVSFTWWYQSCVLSLVPCPVFPFFAHSTTRPGGGRLSSPDDELHAARNIAN